MNPPATVTICPSCGSTALRDGVCTACIFGSALEFLSAGTAAEPVSEAPPQHAGDYELLEEIARGGMGMVWRARHRRLNREVALKFVLEGVLPGEMAARRFRQEAEVAAQLSHPHIIAVYEVGEADGRYFISMELAAGGTLAQRLLQGKFIARAAAELTVTLARAVQHAHERGVLHRDLKPGNILFDAAGEPRISDFGLARLATGRSALTLTGAVMGTPSYMPPEQARGETETLTTAADVYGLGAILYELLAGRPAFAGEVPVEVLRRVIDEEPGRLTGLNRDLETICRKCLAKDPGARYHSARALAEDLERWLAGEPIRARRATPLERLVKWARRKPLLAALWLALMAAAVFIANLILTSRVQVAEARGAAEASAVESQHRRADQHTTAAILAIERGDSLRALPSLTAAISIGTGDARRDRVNRIRFGSILRQAPVLEQMWFPEWPVDVQLPAAEDRMLYCEHHSVFVRRISDGKQAAPQMDAGDKVLHAAMHPSLPRVIAATASGDLQMWDAVTGQHLAQKKGTFLRAPDLFPAGEPCLVTWSGTSVRRFSPAEREFNSPVMEHPAPVEWAWLSPGGRRILTCAADRLLRTWDTDSGALLGTPVSCEAGTAFAGCDPTGFIANVRPAEGPGCVIDLEHGGSAREFNLTGDVRAVSCTEGLTKVARAIRDGFVVSALEGGDVQATANHGSRGNDARFSVDGFRVFTRAIDSGGRLWSLDGGRALTPFLWQGADPLLLALNPAADRILVSSRAPELRSWKVRPGGGAVGLTTLGAAELKLEWLGHEVAERALNLRTTFTSRGENGRPSLVCRGPGASELHVEDPATGRDLCPPLRHLSTVLGAVMSPDGTKIASFTTSQCAYLWDAATGHQIGPLLRHDRGIESIAFSPDSTLLATCGFYTLRVWEASSGTAAAPAMAHLSPIYRMWWRDDSTGVFTIAQEGVKSEWRLTPEERDAAMLQTLAHLYSAHRVTDGGALVPVSMEETRAAWQTVSALPDRP